MERIAEIFAPQWWVPSSGGIILMILVLVVIPALIIIARIPYHRLRDQRINDRQIFLFRLKGLGLSNFQIRIINNLAETLRLKNPNHLLDNPEYFERAVGRFLKRVRETGGDGDSRFAMCRDIVIIYEKLYHQSDAKKPAHSIDDIDDEQLIYFMPENGKIHMGRIDSRNARFLFLKIFGSPGDLEGVPDNAPVTFNIFRIGDAEYDFVSPVAGRDGLTLKIPLPVDIIRRGETRHPFIDVMIPAQIGPGSVQARNRERGMPVDAATGGEKSGADKEEEGIGTVDAMLSCLIYKINNYEAVLRLQRKLDFNNRYFLEFTAMDFHFKIAAKIIASKTVDEATAIFYTMKFEEMSESAARVLKKYIYEHL